MKRYFSLLIVSLFVLGCNRGPLKPEGLPDLLPVTLQLTQEGKPLAGAEVVLHSDATGRWACGGFSDDNGKVVVRTHGRFPGAPEGLHKVAVTKSRSGDGYSGTAGAKSPVEIREMEERQRKYRSAFGQTVYYVEETYSDAATTPLEIDVKRGNNRFDLDVGRAVEIVKKNTSPLG